jgi:TetR/AcrR family transcriptional regulator, regulator of cefoperazone and chloramphenicol sensitivity
MATSTKPSPRAARTDGDATRAHILGTAGQLFAERGFANVTSKEICTQAGANLAAINYHFGSRDGLYEAVLLAAHDQLLDIDVMAGIAAGAGDAKGKFRLIYGGILAQVINRDAGWALRVMMRELLAPSESMQGLAHKAVMPKAKLMKGVLAELLGVAPDHAVVERALAFVMTQAMGMLLVPKDIGLPFSLERDSAALQQDLLSYVLAGLEALRDQYR